MLNHNIALDVKTKTITEKEIFEASRKLKNKFTTGPDNIPCFLIKDCI